MSCARLGGMGRLLTLLFVFCGICMASRVMAADQALPARRVKVLWLGDDGHHVPLERARQTVTYLAQHGIDVTYTDHMSDINPKTLALYDTLMVYANITRISPEQEQAILDYVAAGHGYAPIHCGSYCFLNSQKLTALTGGRFKSHSRPSEFSTR